MYVTQTEFEQAFGQDELSELLANGADFARAEAAAASLAEGYIGAKYALPLAAVPPVLKGWVLDITRYRLWEERAPDEVRRRYEDALGQLRDLARGVLALPPGAGGVQASTGFDSDGYSAERVFTSDTLTDY